MIIAINHSIFQLMACGNQGSLEQLQITNNPHDYHWVSQGVVTVDNMDDKQEFDFTDVSQLIKIAPFFLFY